MVEPVAVNDVVAGSSPALPANPSREEIQKRLREWLEAADDPAHRAWLEYLNRGFIPLNASVHYLRIKNALPAKERELLDSVLANTHRNGYETALAAYGPLRNWK